MTPLPKGYVGKDHETIGSDILAVLGAVSMPRTTLGPKMVEELEGIEPDRWYPITLMLELMERLSERSGPTGLRRMGRELFRRSHQENARKVIHSARDLLHGMDALYRNANRGTAIGGWKVLSFEPGRAELEKATPHHCVMEEGIIGEALAMVGVPATISQRECLREGADACVFVVESGVADARWGGAA